MKIAITGGTGFIGKNFLKTIINDENEYICLIRKESSTANLEIANNLIYKTILFNENELTAALTGVDVVIHMIGQLGGYGVSLSSYESTNCKLTQTMAKACISARVQQLIYISTPGVQGFGHRLCLESEPYAPRNPYEETKVKAEQIIIEVLGPSRVAYTIIRPDFVYGPEDIRRIKMYKNIRSKKFVLTTSGKSYLHPTYVLDVVQGIKKAIGNSHAYNDIFNISAKKDMTTKEYLDTIADHFNVSIIHINIGYYLSIILASTVEYVCNKVFHRDGFVSKNKIDFLALDHSTSSEKAMRLLDYHPCYSFKKGFEETMKWCEKNSLI
mgnify:CR=1 FL=1